MLKQKLIDSCMIDVCSKSSSNAPESMRREPQLSKITYNMSLLILTGGYIPTISLIASKTVSAQLADSPAEPALQLAKPC
jgi:hypothetical protein